jgi:hypothetical protein
MEPTFFATNGLRCTIWKFFQANPTWYRKKATWWVVSAKKEETKERRFKKLMENLQKGEALPQMDRNPKAGSA